VSSGNPLPRRATVRGLPGENALLARCPTRLLSRVIYAICLAAAMVAVHRLLRTWQEQVDVYVALTEFVRRKLIEGGAPKIESW
jgi:hypothetical protein